VRELEAFANDIGVDINDIIPNYEHQRIDRERIRKKIPNSNAVVDSDFLEAIVAKYNFEIRAGLNN
jgi:hypothetical protein